MRYRIPAGALPHPDTHGQSSRRNGRSDAGGPRQLAISRRALAVVEQLDDARVRGARCRVALSFISRQSSRPGGVQAFQAFVPPLLEPSLKPPRGFLGFALDRVLEDVAQVLKRVRSPTSGRSERSGSSKVRNPYAGGLRGALLAGQTAVGVDRDIECRGLCDLPCSAACCRWWSIRREIVGRWCGTVPAG